MLKKLREANLIRAREWGTDIHTDLSFKGNELAGEVGEACNIIKKMERERIGLPGGKTDIPGLTEELADVIICVDLIAAHLDIDLEAAIVTKFNKTSEKIGLVARLA
jgi:NTP pyrophosphatase (non-canonical NTP hydrolase)